MMHNSYFASGAEMGWFFVSIVLPLVAPVLAMWFFQLFPMPVSAAQKSLLVPIKDGQLCWGAVAFCALAMYEIAVPGPDGALVTGDLKEWVRAGFMLIMVPSSLMAAVGAVFPTDINLGLNVPWYKHYKALAASAALTFLSGGAYTVVHYGLLKP